MSECETWRIRSASESPDLSPPSTAPASPLLLDNNEDSITRMPVESDFQLEPTPSSEGDSQKSRPDPKSPPRSPEAPEVVVNTEYILQVKLFCCLA